MKNEFDNNLTDKGWQSMRRLLDREMPEQRRRRFVWWWVGALLLLPLAGAGGWWLFHPSKPANVTPPPVEVPKVSEPVAAAQDLTTFEKLSNLGPLRLVFSPSDGNASGRNLRLHETPLGENTKRGEKPANVTPPSMEVPKVSEPVVEMEGAPNFPKVSNFRKVEPQDFSAVVDGGANNGQVKIEPANSSGNFKSSDELPRDETFRKLATFGKLDALPVNPQFVENKIKNTPKPPTVTPFAAAITKKHPEPKRWSFGLAAGLASEKFSALNGFSAGAAVDWQFAHKWGLRSGLQYAQYRLSKEERPVVAVDATSYAEATDNFVFVTGNGPGATPGIFDPSAVPSVLVPVERLRQLEIPLLAWWQPVRRLRIFGGFSAAYTLSAQVSQQNFANNQFYYPTTKSAQENLNELTANTLPRWQTNWQAGAGVRIGRHFELDVFYKHGFSNTTSSQADQDQNGLFDATWQPRSAGASHYFLLNGIWFF